MLYEIKNIEKLENEIILIRKYLINKYLNKIKYEKNIYNENIENFNKTLNNFIIYLRKNYKNENEIIKLYNYLNFIDYEKIYIKKNNKYTIKKLNHNTNRLKQYKISYKQILEKLINSIVYYLKRFNLKFNDRFK